MVSCLLFPNPTLVVGGFKPVEVRQYVQNPVLKKMWNTHMVDTPVIHQNAGSYCRSFYWLDMSQTRW